MPTYPTSPQLTVEVFLKQPQLSLRRLTELVNSRLIIPDTVFEKGSADQVRGGIARYQRAEAILLDRPVEEVGIRSEFPRAGWIEDVREALVKQYGLEFPINDMAVRRNEFDTLQRGLRKLANSMAIFIDSVFVATLLADPDIQTLTASGDWTTAATDIIKDVVRAKQMIITQEQGYVPDTVVLNDTQWEDVMNDVDIRGTMPRETVDSFVQTGRMPRLLGMNWLPTSRITAGTLLVMDGKMAGTIADEEPTEGGYQTLDPGAGQVPVWMKQYREEKTSDTIIRAVRWPAMWLAEPKAVVKVTGA